MSIIFLFITKTLCLVVYLSTQQDRAGFSSHQKQWEELNSNGQTVIQTTDSYQGKLFWFIIRQWSYKKRFMPPNRIKTKSGESGGSFQLRWVIRLICSHQFIIPSVHGIKRCGSNATSVWEKREREKALGASPNLSLFLSHSLFPSLPDSVCSDVSRVVVGCVCVCVSVCVWVEGGGVGGPDSSRVCRAQSVTAVTLPASLPAGGNELFDAPPSLLPAPMEPGQRFNPAITSATRQI